MAASRRAALIAVCGLVLFSAAARQASSDERYYLNRSADFAVYAYGIHTDPLLREILRQSLLAELRHGYGLVIGDAWLGDAPPATTDDRFDIVMSPGKQNLIELLRGERPTQSAAAGFTMGLPEKQTIDVVRFLAEVDRVVRAEASPEAARLMGRQARRPAAEPLAPEAMKAAVERIAPLVDELTLPTQFAAARELHALIDRHGEAPELVGLLIRTYTHLGLFSEPFCGTMHRAFNGRALVYAQRWSTRDANSPAAAAHRAYALALIGLQKLALDDLAEATRRAAEAPGAAGGLPRWTSLVDAFCRYQTSALERTPEGSPDRQLALLCNYLAVEKTTSAARITAAVLAAQVAAPECYNLLDSFGHPNSYSYEFEFAGFDRSQTQEALYKVQQTMLGSRLYERLKAMSGLPPAVAQVLVAYDPQATPPGSAAEYALRGRVIDALLAADNSSEPLSWPVLGRLVREESFRQALLSDEFDNGAHGDLPRDMLPLVAAHPLRPYFQLRDTRAPNRDEPIDRLIAGVDQEAMDLQTIRLLGILAPSDGTFQPAKAGRFYSQAASITGQRGRNSHEMFHEVRGRMFPPVDGTLRRYLEVDPYCPQAAYLALKHLPEKYATYFDSWQALRGDHPEIDALLLARAPADADPLKQEAQLQAALEKNPDPAMALKLAELQLARNDLDAWEKTMRAYLARAADEAEAVKICVEAAKTLMRRREFARARPFAEAAYEHDSYRATNVLTETLEGVQDWPAAEKVIRDACENSGSFSFRWYFFCRRTGQGNSGAAFELADQEMRNSFNTNWTAYYYRLQNEPERAASIFRTFASSGGNPEYGLHAVLLHDELGLVAERDTLLKTIREKGSKWKDRDLNRVRAGLVGLAKLIEDDLKAGGKAEFDEAALEKLRTDNGPDQADFDCALGYYYDQHGRPDKATEAWLRCMTSPDIARPARTLAGAKLWDRSIGPAAYRDALQGRAAVEKTEPRP